MDSECRETAPPSAPGPIFIVGCWRSGTTLLRDLLRSHPNLAFGLESEFIPWVTARHGDPTDVRTARRLGQDICRRLAAQNYPVDLTAADFDHCRSAAQAVALPFERFAEQVGKPRWGDKTPFYVEHIDQIHELFPTAKFLHIVRDGRDCALSIRERPFGPNTIFHAARIWRRYVQKGRQARRRLGPEVVHEVRFERLVAEPEPVLRRIVEFVDEPWHEATLRRSPPLGKRKVAKFGRPLPDPFHGSQIRPDRAQRWPNGMTDEEQAIFEGIAGDLLDELGYTTRGIGRAASRWERAAWRLENDTKRIWRHAQYGSLGFRLWDEVLRFAGRFPSR